MHFFEFAQTAIASLQETVQGRPGIEAINSGKRLPDMGQSKALLRFMGHKTAGKASM